MKKFSIRTISLILCMSMLLGYALIPGMLPAVLAAERTEIVGNNLINNGTFDLQGSSEKPEGWTVKSGWWEFIKVEGYDGKDTFVAHTIDDSIDRGGVIYYKIGKDEVEAGTYCLELKYKTLDEVSRNTLYVREISHASTYIDSTGASVTTPGQQTALAPTNGEWATHTRLFTVTGEEDVFILLTSGSTAVSNTYFDDISFYSVNMEKMEAQQRFQNLGFEKVDADGTVTNWQALDDGTIAVSADAKAGNNSLQVTDDSKDAQQGAVSDWCDLYNYTALKYDTNDLRFVLSGRVKDTTDVNGQIALEFYDAGLHKLDEIAVTSAKTGEWQYLSTEGKMPSRTAYARIKVRVGDSAAANGTVCFDDLTVMHYYGQYVDEPYAWELLDSEPGNRLYYTDEELAAIKKFAKDETVGTFGVSGKAMYDEVIKTANKLKDRTSYSYKYEREDYGWPNIEYQYDMITMQDVNSIEEFVTIEEGKSPWPHLETLSNAFRSYTQYLSLAYVLTNESVDEDKDGVPDRNKYAEKAIHIAMGICEWEYWTELDYAWIGALTTELGIPRVVMSVATVYDMCYDAMTEEQRQFMEQSIINKGLLPMYNSLTGPKKQAAHNKAMITCASLMFGALAIIDEDNMDVVGKFLDRAYAYNKWFLDYQYETGSNEGYSYSRACYEDPAVSMSCLTRVTGRQGLLDHPYIDEVFVNWVCEFLMPGSYDLPEYSDCHGATETLYKTIMLILNKHNGNGKAGYYLQKTGLSDSPIAVLLYNSPNPVITEPTERDYVAFIDCVGYGGLRTGWQDGDMMLYIIGNNSQLGHNQYDQLSFQIATADGENALLLAADPGYQRLDGFGEREGHSTIIVDGWGQTVKGQGSLSQIIDGQLYGQLSGSAPGAYGEGLLTQYDRHAIMINHEDRPYYILIDELNSDSEHVYDWNLNTKGWSEVTVDGVTLGGTVLTGNKVAISGTNGKLFAEFVSKDKLNIEAKLYPTVEGYFSGSAKGDYIGADYPVLQADAGSTKSQQYLTILSKDYDGSATSPIYTQEVYDTDSVLGAKIYHNAYNSDIVLHNRTTGSITAGGVTTNGKQTTIIGLRGNGYMEGYAVVGGTSLSLNNTLLMESQTAATVSADFRGKASYIVTTETAQTIALYASGEITGVTVNGESVEFTVSNGMASIALAEGTHAVKLAVSDAVEYIHTEDGTLEMIVYYQNGQYAYATDADGNVIICKNHDYEEEVIAPTCTEIGCTIYTCSHCGDQYVENMTAATGHKWKAATCTAPKTCSACGITQGTALGHTYVDGTCSACGAACKHTYVDGTCSACGAACKHTYVDGKCSSCGVECVHNAPEGYCTICGLELPAHIIEKEELFSNGALQSTDENGTVQFSYNGYKNATKTSGWNGLANLPESTEGLANYTVFEWENGNASNAVLHVYDNSTDAAAIQYYQYKLEKGTEYTLKFDAKRIGTQSPTVYVRTPGTNEVLLRITPSKDVWDTYEGTFTIPEEDYSHFVIRVGTGGLGDGFDALFDNFSLVKTCTHNWENPVVSDADCTNKATRTVTCSDCGAIGVTEYGEALGHTWVGGTCSVCKEACDHSYKAVVTVPTCTEAGYTTYTCACGDTYTGDEVDALGHAYDNDTDKDCNNCGEVREVGPFADANLKFVGTAPSLSFQDYIGLNIMFQNSVASEYEKFYVKAVQVTSNGTKVSETECRTVDYTYKGVEYTIIEHPVMAWDMTDVVTLTLYAEKDGVVYVGQSITASVASRALEMLASYEGKEGKDLDRTTLVDMLNYGAALQVNQSHNVDSLPNAGDYAKYGTAAAPELSATTSKTGDGTAFINGPAISMQAKVEFNVMFMIAELEGKTVKVLADGVAVDAEAIEYLDSGEYRIARVAIKAIEMRSTYTIALYDGDTPVSKVITTSVEALCLQNINNNRNVDLANALMCYGDSVSAFANK